MVVTVAEGWHSGPYQFWLSQSSSAGARGVAFLAALTLASPPVPSQLSQPSLLLLRLDEPHTSQLSELRFSVEASAQVQLSLLGDAALGGSGLPKLSQKFWSRALLLWRLSPPPSRAPGPTGTLREVGAWVTACPAPRLALLPAQHPAEDTAHPSPWPVTHG